MINHDRDQLILVTSEPLAEAKPLGFIKGVLCDETGKWQISVTPNVDEALQFGDESQILINWFNADHGINFQDIDPAPHCQFSRMHKQILSR